MLKRRMSALVSAMVRRRVVLLGVSLPLVLTLSLVACAGPTPASVTVPAPTSTPLTKPIPVPIPTPLLEPTWAPALAPFQVTDLMVSPAEVKPGEAVVITADLTNTGDAKDSYTIELRINGTAVLAAEVNVPVGETAEVRFSGREEASGTYVVSLGEASGQFVVVEPGETLLVSAPAPGSAAPEQSTPNCCGGSVEPVRSGCGCTEHPELLQRNPQAGASEPDVPSCCG